MDSAIASTVVVARAQGVDDLLLPLPPVLEVAGAGAPADRRSPGRAPGSRRLGSSASSRSSDARYCVEIAAAARRRSSRCCPATTRSPVNERAARLVPEREVIGRVPGRVERRSTARRRRRRRRRRRAAATRRGTVRLPPATGYLANAAAGMRGGERRRAGGVIAVAVRHEHRVEPRVALVRRRLELASRCRGSPTPASISAADRRPAGRASR